MGEFVAMVDLSDRTVIVDGIATFEEAQKIGSMLEELYGGVAEVFETEGVM